MSSECSGWPSLGPEIIKQFISKVLFSNELLTLKSFWHNQWRMQEHYDHRWTITEKLNFIKFNFKKFSLFLKILKRQNLNKTKHYNILVWIKITYLVKNHLIGQMTFQCIWHLHQKMIKKKKRKRLSSIKKEKGVMYTNIYFIK